MHFDKVSGNTMDSFSIGRNKKKIEMKRFKFSGAKISKFVFIDNLHSQVYCTCLQIH